jgi:hypothetical protein
VLSQQSSKPRNEARQPRCVADEHGRQCVHDRCVVSAWLAHLERDAQTGVHDDPRRGAGGLRAATAGAHTGCKRGLDHYERVPLSVSSAGGNSPGQPMGRDAVGSGRSSCSNGGIAARRSSCVLRRGRG